MLRQTFRRPAMVVAALEAADRIGFEHSCRDEVGQFLRILASQPRVAELGTGAGVGAAWLASANPGELVTVEADAQLADHAASVLGPAADVVVGDWSVLLDREPFDLVFSDARAAKYDSRGVDLLAPGGVLVVDDLTPAALQPDGWSPADDPLRVLLSRPPLISSEVQVASDHSVMLVRVG